MVHWYAHNFQSNTILQCCAHTEVMSYTAHLQKMHAVSWFAGLKNNALIWLSLNESCLKTFFSRCFSFWDENISANIRQKNKENPDPVFASGSVCLQLAQKTGGWNMELCVTEEMIGLEINLIITTVASKRNINFKTIRVTEKTRCLYKENALCLVDGKTVEQKWFVFVLTWSQPFSDLGLSWPRYTICMIFWISFPSSSNMCLWDRGRPDPHTHVLYINSIKIHNELCLIFSSGLWMLLHCSF